MAEHEGWPFERHLGRFLLLAYASGDEVVGNWLLLDSDDMVPNLEVTIERVDAGGGATVDHAGATAFPASRADFRERLQTFVLERFVEGDDVEGIWRVRFPRTSLPTWEVRISSDADAEVVPDDEISSFE